jgi:hypothetical protein
MTFACIDGATPKNVSNFHFYVLERKNTLQILVKDKNKYTPPHKIM